jgi:hypothetical protein
MMSIIVYEIHTGKAEIMSDFFAEKAIIEGTHSLPMDAMIPMVGPHGTIVSIKGSGVQEALQTGWHFPTQSQSNSHASESTASNASHDTALLIAGWSGAGIIVIFFCIFGIKILNKLIRSGKVTYRNVFEFVCIVFSFFMWGPVAGLLSILIVGMEQAITILHLIKNKV